MAKGVYVKLNKDGVSELLKSGEIAATVTQYAQAVASRAGDGYDYQVFVGNRRCYANVFPATAEAAKDHYKNNSLVKAIS